MATTLKRLVEGTVLTASAVTQYTAPALTTTVIKKVTATNTTGTAQTITLYLVPSGGSVGAAATNTITLSVPANSGVELYLAENHNLAPGDFISALASAVTSITLMASGIEVV
jgi:hypothetical protein